MQSKPQRIARNVVTAASLVCLPWIMSCLIDRIGGAHDFQENKPASTLSAPARTLIEAAYQGIDPARMLDYHVHIVSLGTTCKDCHINERFFSLLHPIKNVRFKVYASASGVTDFSNADDLYLNRLIHVAEGMERRGRFVILAFDRSYDEFGKYSEESTDFYVTNEYAFAAAARSPLLIPAISVHPLREGAVADLEKWARRGARIVKWLPNAMRINPSDPRILPYYTVMRKYDMILLSHTGEERAVDADEYQELGNPLLLRVPLDHGVKVIMSHCASLGEATDIDNPARPEVANFDLFVRMMKTPGYNGRLFGDISALTQFNRVGRHPEPQPLRYLLEHPEMQKRLVNGSDYPLPAINIVIRTSLLQKLGFITQEESESLNEIYRFNPLLFDFVLKRTVHHPDDAQRKLSPGIFHENENLRPFAGNN